VARRRKQEVGATQDLGYISVPTTILVTNQLVAPPSL
jgi:hypothetical protein